VNNGIAQLSLIELMFFFIVKMHVHNGIAGQCITAVKAYLKKQSMRLIVSVCNLHIKFENKSGVLSLGVIMDI
jgi:hypothetical protein